MNLNPNKDRAFKEIDKLIKNITDQILEKLDFISMCENLTSKEFDAALIYICVIISSNFFSCLIHALEINDDRANKILNSFTTQIKDKTIFNIKKFKRKKQPYL